MSSSCNSGLNMKETELSLSLPGRHKQGTKRRFFDTVDLKLGQFENDEESEDSFVVDEKATPKAQVVGWPPVRAYRKNMKIMKNSKYVKVAVDGAPYLRKVDLEMFSSYQHLLNAFQNMFTCLTIQNVLHKKKLVDSTNGSEYVATYEDKDGDWMLLGDVPWKMFVESCKKIRLMTSLKTIGIAPRTLSSKSPTASYE